MAPTSDRQVIDLTVRLGILALFLYGSFVLVAPLVGLILWSVILTVAVYPLHEVLSRWLGGRKKLSAGLLTTVGLIIALGPVALLAAGIVEAHTAVSGLLKDGTFHVPQPPSGVADWPLVGKQLSELWSGAHTNLTSTLERFGPNLLKAARPLLGEIAVLGIGLVTILVSVVVMGGLLVVGPKMVADAHLAARRISGSKGPEVVQLSVATVRSVSRGVIGVAVVQALLGGIIMGIFGLKAAGPLALATLLLCVIQIGPVPVILPTIIWAWTAMEPGQALAFTLLLSPLALIDNVLKPIFIAAGQDVPILVILVGVAGGILAYGVVGIFIGPVFLAVFHKLFYHWLQNDADDESDVPASADEAV